LAVARIQDRDYPEDLYYDIENQIWYEPLADGSIRVGMTPIAVSLAGEILVFTPKRIGRTFDKGRSFATLEGGKWVGSARAAFDGIVVASNEALVARPSLLSQDAFGAGWMLLVRATRSDWGAGLITGTAIGPAFSDWIAAEAYKDRTE
jgi:glycine cleavage system H protein